MLLSPLIYFSTFYTICASTEGFFTLLLRLFLWAFFGFLILLYIQLFDLYQLCDILSMHDGCKANSEHGVQVAPDDEE